MDIKYIGEEVLKRDKVAQISLHKIIKTKVIGMDENDFNDNDTNRDGGFGHSGIN